MNDNNDVKAFISRAEQHGTPSLDEYMEVMYSDPNLVWRLDIGHINNLFDQALEIVEDLRLLHHPVDVDGVIRCATCVGVDGVLSRWPTSTDEALYPTTLNASDLF